MKLFLLDMFCALTISVIDLAFPFISRMCMYKLLPEGAFKTFFIVMLIMLFAYVIRSIFSFIIGFYGHRFGILVETDMRKAVFSHIQSLGFDFFDNVRLGQLLSRLTTDLFDITELAHHGPEDIFISFVTIMGAIIIMFMIQWKLAIIIAIMIPLFLFVVWKLRINFMKASKKLKATTALINADFESNLSGIRTAKAFANEDTELHKFDKANVNYRNAKYDLHRAMAIFNATMEFCLSMLPLVVIAFGGFLIMRNELSLVDLVTFSLYITTFVTPVRRLATTAELFSTGIAGLDRFAEIMNTNSNLVDAKDAKDLTNVKGNIDIINVSFAYGNANVGADTIRTTTATTSPSVGEDIIRPTDVNAPFVGADIIRPTEKIIFTNSKTKQILKNISLKINAGETVALVGASGGGKTTLAQLILRFYDVNSGKILIDGQDVRKVTQESIHKNIGVVQQDVFLFPTTIYDNIKYGKVDASREEVLEASKRAEVYDDIMHMENGFDTNVGDRGVRLSGGQKQRISIARIFLKNPKILILDEATSALDGITEVKIQKTFDELSKGRTTIIIAHRLSTIKNADRIVIIENGEIKDIGKYNELIEKSSLFAKLVASQEI